MMELNNIPESPEILIVDQFYDNIDWVVPYIESQVPLDRLKANYGGSAFIPPVKENRFALDKLESILRRKLNKNAVNGELRLTLKQSETEYKTFVHVDMSLNAVIYLSGEELQSGGTSFYRHKELGMTFVHPDHHQQKKLDMILPFDTNDHSRWELVCEVPFKKNRAVIFNGKYFHAVPSIFYGTSIKTGRITQNFFFPELSELFKLK